MTKRHVEISGAGLGGLSAAIAFARSGWSVTVHERAPRIRATGAGIFIAENGIRVLEALGADREALRGGIPFYTREARDQNGKVIGAHHWPKGSGLRIQVLSRETLVQALAGVARELGVEICLDSQVVGADAGGTLYLEGGVARQADLVVGADGVNSLMRDSMKFEGTRQSLRSGAIRAIVPRFEADRDLPEDTYAEYWSGKRRVFFAPVSRDATFLALMTVSDDREGSREPPNLESWIETFPAIGHVLQRIDNPLRWALFEEIKLKSWSKGKVALIGDAAHAMAPNLGQGGGTALMDGISLATNLADDREDLATALRRWESRERPVVDRVQWYSSLYGRLCDWPVTTRNFALWLLGKSEWLKKQRMCAHEFKADGVSTAPLPEGVASHA